jgi:hypothetical protein
MDNTPARTRRLRSVTTYQRFSKSSRSTASINKRDTTTTGTATPGITNSHQPNGRPSLCNASEPTTGRITSQAKAAKAARVFTPQITNRYR